MRVKIVKIALDGFGSFLGMERGCFVVRDKEGKARRYPLFESEIGEVILRSGNTVSTGALASLGFWDIDVLILSNNGKPVAMVRSLNSDSHVRTRIAQYEALNNGKGIHIAKQIVFKKLEGQNLVLKKYGLKQHDLISVKERIKSFLNDSKGTDKIEFDNLKALRRKLLPIEGNCSDLYFKQIVQLFPRNIVRTNNRRTFRAYDGLNNTFNLVYSLLKWKVHIALLKAKLEPFLGFLHSEEAGKPSLICDMVELYRYMADDFLIKYCQKFTSKDFVVKTEQYIPNRRGMREYLNDSMTNRLIRAFYDYLDWKVRIPRIRHGYRQSLETLINEESLLFAKYLRNERETWIPRIALPFYY
jgi:CRISPR-associated protein Cas1